jgi:CheY-like chemotaxis protein/anti-sigma regulatory factor (Ser/Thr protein kinase)
MGMAGKPKVLVVDDQEAVRTLLARLLDREGFVPVLAADGEEAIEAYRAESPLVVVSDIMMPKKDGLSLLSEIKTIDGNAAVILITGLGSEDILLRALRGGAANFFKKPFNLQELVEEIRKIASFKLEAERSAHFSPFLVEEAKSFVLDRPDAPYFPIINQVTLQLPALLRPDEILNVKIGIEEMVANAIEHGTLGISYGEKSDAMAEGRLAELTEERTRASIAAGKKVRISSRLTRELFELTVEDEGSGFDWRGLPEVSAENLLMFSGRGIFLTKIYFDEVVYNAKGNSVTLRKRRKAPVGSDAAEGSGGAAGSSRPSGEAPRAIHN